MIVGIGKVGEGKHNVSIRVGELGHTLRMRCYGARLSPRAIREWPSTASARQSSDPAFAVSALPVITLVLRSTSSVPPSLALVMSQTTTTSESSSRFRALFHAALKSYQKQTKTDLIAHPLVSQLQSCDNTAAIVAILQDQLRDLDKSRSGDDRLTRWLNPTVNVLSAFSATVSGGVSLVLMLM